MRQSLFRAFGAGVTVGAILEQNLRLNIRSIPVPVSRNAVAHSSQHQLFMPFPGFFLNAAIIVIAGKIILSMQPARVQF